MDWDVIIAGAGLGGLCAASGLRLAGVRVLVLERDVSALSRQQGYRININLAGDAALRACLSANHYLLYQETSHRQNDSSVDIFDSNLQLLLHRTAEAPASGPPPAAVDRATLRAILLDAAKSVRFNTPVVDAISTDRDVKVLLRDGSRLTCGLLIAADGASSRLRQKFFRGHDPRPLGTIALYGKAPLNTERPTWIPNGILQQRFVGITDKAGTTLALGAWYPRRDPLEGARALVPGLVITATVPYVMCVLMVAAGVAPNPASDAVELHEFMLETTQCWNPAATQFLREADVNSIFRIPLRAVPSVPEWPTGRITFLGDSIHAMSPAGGEGANTAMADAASLVSAFNQSGIDGIAAYESEMRHRARLALQRSASYGRTNESEGTHYA
jgi:2-polyprenyl-6-methoxyphenol hydroxylase-like FAD-dependent oxidoreductase